MATTLGGSQVRPPSRERLASIASRQLSFSTTSVVVISAPSASSTTRSGSMPGMVVWRGSLQVAPSSSLNQIHTPEGRSMW